MNYNNMEGLDNDDELSMVPEKDDGQFYNNQQLGVQAEAAFNQQRVVVSRLPREELEDRYLRLLEENVVIKKHACKQEDKIKKLATKLIRVLSDKKRLEMDGGGGGDGIGVPGGAIKRDIETEEMLEDQQQKIRELERHNMQLKDKLMVTKQQLLSITSGKGGQKRNVPRAVAHPMMKNQPAYNQPPVLPTPSPIPMMHSGAMPQQQLISQQAQRLLEEAKNENTMLEETVATLKEQLNIFEQEVEQIREQAKIKEANYEEEIGILKEQVKDREAQTVTENIELIRLQQEKKSRTSQIATLKAQLQGLESTVSKLKTEESKLKRDNLDLNSKLQEEQGKSIALSKEVQTNTSSKQALLETKEKIRDLERENAILRESNEKLLDSAYNVERERKFLASENALKVQVAQLETTLKADLTDKRSLTEILSKERESYAKLEADYKDLQSRHFQLKENIEGKDEAYFAKEHTVSQEDLEEALALIKQKKKSAENGGEFEAKGPSFLESLDGSKSDVQADMKAELAELQVHHVEAVNELEKTRSLLKAQGNINRELKQEADALKSRLQQVTNEFQVQLGEYKKLLDMRAARIQKLEIQLREAAYSQVQKLSDTQITASTTTVHTPSGQSMFEVHVQKAQLTKECLLSIGTDQPPLFATWTFYDHDIQYTPITRGSEAVFDCSAYYKIKLDDSFLDYLSGSNVQVNWAF